MTLGYTHLKIELLNFDGGYGYAEYDFNVENELNQYRIYAAWKTGNTDGMIVKFIWILYFLVFQIYCSAKNFNISKL